MKLKERLITLRIGKGLVSLLALFVMLLTPHEAWAEDYDLWIGDVRVTDANKDNLAAANSNIKVGNATFDSENNILYLNGIQTKDCIKSELASLRISLQGANRIGYIANAEDHPAIYSEETHGTLAFMKPQNYASLYVESMMVESVIYGFSSFNFSNFNVDPSENAHYSQELGLNDGEYGVMEATFYTGSLYDIRVGETRVTSGNLSDIKDDNISAGTVSYNPTANILTLNNVNINMGSDDPYVVESSIENLKVRLVGENEVTLDAEMYGTTGPNPIAFANFTGTAGETSPTLTFKSEWDKNNSSFGSLTINGAATETIIAQGYTVSNTWVTNDNVTNGWKKTVNSDDVKVWYRGETYDLIINGVKVTTDNAENVLEGYGSGVISFNASTNTLTLNDLMDYPEDGAPYITNGLESLTIHLLGNSRILGNNTYFLVKNGDGEGNNTVTFTTDSQNPGSLEFYGTNISPWYTGHTVNWSNGFGWRFDGDSDYGSSVKITADNSLSVGDVILCDKNGVAFNEGPWGESVTYDEDTQTLTLNNATINGNIVSSLADDLTVHLVGENVIHNGEHAFLMAGDGSLKFTAADGAKLLTDATTDAMFAYSTSSNSAISFGINDLPSGYKLSFDAELKRSIGESYDVLIYAFTNGSSNLGPQCITSANCDRLAGAYDETTSTWDNETITLSYDYATTTLTLNNLNIETASPNGTVYFINCDGSKAKNITINLLGNNLLRQFEGEEGARFIYNGAEDGSITITTDPENPGMLTMPDLEDYLEETDVLEMRYDNHVKYENSLGYVKDENNVRYIKTVSTVPSLGLTVAGVPVTASNAANVLDQVNEDTELPTVVFDAENNILTLNGAEINVESEDAIVSSLDSLTVFLVGENIISCYGDKVFNKTSAVDEAKITFITDVESKGSLYFMCLEEQIFGEGVTPFYTNLSLKHDGDSHTIDSSLGLSVAGVAVTPFNQSNVLGTPEGTTPTVSFTPAVTSPATPAKLTLNNANFEGTITWDNSADLTVEILGSNTVDTQHRTFLEGNEDASLTLTTNSTNPGNLLLTSCYSYEVLSGWKNVSDIIYDKDNLEMDALDYDWYFDGYSEEWHVRFNQKYNLWVDDVQLCEAQNEVAFDPEDYSGNRITFEDGMLKFNNVSKNTEESPFIVNGVGDLTILLQGTNTVGCGSLFLGKKTGDADHKVTFKTTEELEGTLVITTTGDEDDPWYEGHDTPTVKDLIFTDKMIEETRTLTFAAPTPYDLSVAGVTVTNANATAITGDNITGTVTYNDETHTLTLDNVTIDLTDEENEGPGIKYSGTANLIIVLNGTNSIKVQSGCEPIIYDAEEVPPTVPTLTFERGSHPCSLELQGVNSPVIKYFANVLGVNGINDVTGNFLKLDSETAVAYSQTDGLHTVQDSETSPVTSAKIVSFLLDPKFSFSDSENSGIPSGGTMYYNYGQEYTMPVLKRWDDGYQTDLSGFSITYTSSDENVATISNTGVITIVGGGWAEIKAVSKETDVYAADSTWFTMEVKPADPIVSLEEGAYFTGQKLTLTREGLSGSMYYSYGYKETSERTAYDGEISLPAGEYDFYPYTRCGTDEQNIWSYGNAHRMLYVYDQPTINKNSGEYEGDIEVEITNLPESGSVTVYYYFGDDEENAELHTYTAGDKITVRESTKLNVYLLVEGDSGKTHKTEVIERQYVIKDISLAVTSDDFHNHWTTYYNTNGNVALPENENIGAYIASEIGEHTVTVTQIKSIPRGVPVFLNNETTGTTENTNVTGNLLIHADEDVVVDGDFTYYGLYNGMMKRVHGTISAGNNYLLMPTATQPQGAQQLNIVIDNGIETTISEIEKMRNEGNETYFDLQGRKLSGKPSKEGVYIKNGTKVVLK